MGVKARIHPSFQPFKIQKLEKKNIFVCLVRNHTHNSWYFPEFAKVNYYKMYYNWDFWYLPDAIDFPSPENKTLEHIKLGTWMRKSSKRECSAHTLMSPYPAVANTSDIPLQTHKIIFIININTTVFHSCKTWSQILEQTYLTHITSLMNKLHIVVAFKNGYVPNFSETFFYTKYF